MRANFSFDSLCIVGALIPHGVSVFGQESSVKVSCVDLLD